MRVLLTGANGFIGSHILERLLLSDFDVTILLRRTSDTRFIEPLLSRVDIRYGSLESEVSLGEAACDAEVVIHCAAKTKAVRRAEYYAVNAEGTRNLVEACNTRAPCLGQFIFVSSLAVAGPAMPDSPAGEAGRPRPVSAYGKSKLLAEQYVRRHSRAPHTILRPAAVYGPRDRDFRGAFLAVRRGFMPLPKGGTQPLSLIYVTDLAEAIVRAIGCSRCQGKTYHLAHPVPSTQRGFLSEVAEAMGVEAASLPVPVIALYPVCLMRDLWARVTSRPSIMNLAKIPELAARGWVCATDRAAEDLGFVAGTSLAEGIRLTLAWYEDNGWL